MTDIVERLTDTPCDREPFTPEHAGCRCRLASEAAREIERLREALTDLVDAPALSGVPELVAGWNGPPDKPHKPHPPQLGARIETTCGRIYKLDVVLANARKALGRGEVKSHE